MAHIEPMDLGSDSFLFSCRTETRDQHWRMFHAHQGLEFLYVHEGEGTVTVNGRAYPLHPDRLFCFQPFQLHKVEVPPRDGFTYIRSNLTFDPRIAERYLVPFPNLQAFYRKLWRGNLKQPFFDLGTDHSLPNLLESYNIRRGTVNAKATGEEDRALLLIAILRQLEQHASLLPGAVSGSARTESPHIQKIQDWIEANFRSPFVLESLSNELFLSTHHICHLYKKHTGQKLTATIAARRIREACMLLANTDKPVSEVARECAGLDSSYFCQFFKKHMGVTPQTYRASVRKA
ncbi:AraC family transcriptional regulator [Paenibacillus gansuensis]|uniref:AraC family transcriptional regulator n=1 Tax=Paenibacillus gansuensis TaxID=306542 RepID=A0ABW5PBX3_9BACL